MRRYALLALLAALWAAPAAAQMPALVFFEPHSAALGEPAEAILRRFAAEAAQSRDAIEIRGFADPEGGVPYNRALSLARAEHVAHRLREFGLPAERLRIAARGPVSSVIDDQESRRVEVRILR